MKKGKIKRSTGQIRKLEKRRDHRMPIPLDTAKIRRKFEKRYEMAEKELDEKRKEWKIFEETDKLAFQQWFRISFGRQLAEIRSLQEEIRLKSVIIDRVYDERDFTGASYYVAYQRVLRDEDIGMQEWNRMKNGHPDDERNCENAYGGYYEDLDSDLDDEDFESDEEYEEFDDDLEEIFNHIRREFSPHEKGLENDIGSLLDDLRRSGRDERQRLKEAYRKFCKIMHPDLGTVFDERAASLWNEAQMAYEDHDLDKLEALLSIAEMGDGAFTPKTSCSQIQEAIFHLQGETESLNYELRLAKKDPAWKFSSSSDKRRKKLEKDFCKEVSQEMSKMRVQLARLQVQIAKWDKLHDNRKQKIKNTPADQDLQMNFNF